VHLSPPQTDRAAGVLLGQACGDALGVPYEFASRRYDPAAGPQLAGGGLGGYAPGEWSDDTQMATCIAQVAATGRDLAGPDALDAIAEGFLRWLDDGPADIGSQTSAVLRSARRHAADARPSAVMADAARRLHERTGRTAGNGALMRTAVVGLTRLADRDATAQAARAVAGLTHHDPLAGDSCVLWSEAVRRAVVDGVLDVRGGLDLVPAERRDLWTHAVDRAEQDDPSTFTPNGCTVPALQAAWSSIHHTLPETDPGPDHVRAALHTAIGIGHDTDTVAAVGGGLLGARYGVSALPLAWTRAVHGWPGIRGRDLVHLSLRTARQGPEAPQTWPSAQRMDTGRERGLAAPLASDPDVLLGTFADLSRTRELGVDAVVSLCRLGTREFAPPGVAPADHAEVWLVDSEDPVSNQHLAWLLDEAARDVAQLRAEGRRVLLHCVAAHHRTPAVALRYLLGRGLDHEAAVAEVHATLGREVDGGLLWKEAQRDR
jgi:ADP-ribosylglycohydrolase